MARVDDDFSDGEGSDDDLPSGDEGGGRSGKRKLLLIIPVVLLLVGAGVGGWAYFTGRLQPLLDKMHSHEEAAAPVPEPVYYDVPDVLVDIEKEGKRGSYLKLRASLQLEDKADVDFVDGRLPVVTDCFETHLRELRLEDLPRPGGMEGLRVELRDRLNQRLGRPVVKDVLLKEILLGTTG